MKKQKKIASGLMGAMLLAGNLSGCSSADSASPEVTVQTAASIGGAVAARQAGTSMGNAFADGQTVLSQAGYAAVADEHFIEVPASSLTGEFTFNQEVLSPANDVFNMYGTALTGVCAKPAFAMEEEGELVGDYYVNISGQVQKSGQIGLQEFAYKEEHKIAACTCATGPGIVNAQITGLRLADLLELAALLPEANVITVKGADGYGIPMPLQYALEKEAMLVYRIDGQDFPAGQGPQLWVPGAVARYFTRNVVEIELGCEAEPPSVETASDEYRAKIGLLNHMEEGIALGRTIVFEGYADDCESPIQAVEFSMDGGRTWRSCETSEAVSERWVYWQFCFQPEKAGQYELQVRARTCDGTVSPVFAVLDFEVEEEAAAIRQSMRNSP